MKIWRPFFIAFVLISMYGCTDRAEPLEGDSLTILQGVTVIDGTGAEPWEDAVIVIEGDRIIAVGDVGDYRYPADATIIDLQGHYALPGFMDLHAHVRDNMMRTFLAFGITTIRNPSAGPRNTSSGPSRGVDLREQVKAGEVLGPRVFTAGETLNTPAFSSGQGIEFETEADLRAEIQTEIASGVDYVKLYWGIDPQMLSVAVEEAHSRGVKVIGHLKRTSWTEAAVRGINSLVHSCSEGPIWELLEEEERDPFHSNDWGEYLRSWARTAPQVNLDGSRMAALIDALLRNDVEVNPTLVQAEALYWADDSEHLELQQPSFAPEGFASTWSENWRRSAEFMRGLELTDDEWQELKEGFRMCGQMTRTFHERGVLLTTGSDVGGWMTPGVSLHRELELLVETGIPTLDVIKIATHNGARALGILDEVGTLEPGKIADIVVLQGNPVDDIRNTQTIVSVFSAGREYSPESLLQE